MLNSVRTVITVTNTLCDDQFFRVKEIVPPTLITEGYVITLRCNQFSFIINQTICMECG